MKTRLLTLGLGALLLAAYVPNGTVPAPERAVPAVSSIQAEVAVEAYRAVTGTPGAMPEPAPTTTTAATPTWEQRWAEDGVQLTAHLTAHRCRQYLPLIDRWNPDFDLPTEVVLAVMAQESACMPGQSDGVSVGLMAVTPRPWLFSEDELSDPAINIYAGMYVLAGALKQADGNMRTALAAYNCGWESLLADKCLEIGGYHYAEHVLDFWLPVIVGLEKGSEQ